MYLKNIRDLQRMKLKNCESSLTWTFTEVYDALRVYINIEFDGLREDIVQISAQLCHRACGKELKVRRAAKKG